MFAITFEFASFVFCGSLLCMLIFVSILIVVTLLMIVIWDQREVFCMTMAVELNRWRATIECFRASILVLSPLKNVFRLTSFLVQVARLFCFCYGSLAILIPVLPFALSIHFLTLHCLTDKLYFFFFLFCMHLLAKTIVYMTAKTQFIFSILAQHQWRS